MAAPVADYGGHLKLLTPHPPPLTAHHGALGHGDFFPHKLKRDSVDVLNDDEVEERNTLTSIAEQEAASSSVFDDLFHANSDTSDSDPEESAVKRDINSYTTSFDDFAPHQSDVKFPNGNFGARRRPKRIVRRRQRQPLSSK